MISMKCTPTNIDQVCEAVKQNLEDENGRGEFDNETDLLHAFKTIIEWIENERRNEGK